MEKNVLANPDLILVSLSLSHPTGIQLNSGYHGDFAQHWSRHFVRPFFYLNSSLPSVPLVKLRQYQNNISSGPGPFSFLNKRPTTSNEVTTELRKATQNWAQRFGLLFCPQRALVFIS